MPHSAATRMEHPIMYITMSGGISGTIIPPGLPYCLEAIPAQVSQEALTISLTILYTGFHPKAIVNEIHIIIDSIFNFPL